MIYGCVPKPLGMGWCLSPTTGCTRSAKRHRTWSRRFISRIGPSPGPPHLTGRLVAHERGKKAATQYAGWRNARCQCDFCCGGRLCRATGSRDCPGPMIKGLADFTPAFPIKSNDGIARGGLMCGRCHSPFPPPDEQQPRRQGHKDCEQQARQHGCHDCQN